MRPSDWGWITDDVCNGQFLLWIKRFYIIPDFFAPCLTTQVLLFRLSTYGYILYIYYIPLDNADMATTEAFKLEVINIIVYIRAIFFDVTVHAVFDKLWQVRCAGTLFNLCVIYFFL